MYRQANWFAGYNCETLLSRQTSVANVQPRVGLSSCKEFLVLGSCVAKRVPRFIQRVAALILLAHTIDDEHQYKYDQQQYQHCATNESCMHQSQRQLYQTLLLHLGKQSHQCSTASYKIHISHLISPASKNSCQDTDFTAC